MIYPQRPQGANPEIIQPSSDFKKESKRVLFLIILFILVYLLMVVFGFGMLVSFCYLAFVLISADINFLTIMIGASLGLVGLMVFYFLIKFLFSSHKVDRTHLYEVKRKDEPQLFEFIDKVNEETNSPKPKKIYLSNEVNAFVFYDSSFWSMFVPSKKNLNIGLGLINSVNISEFKAILAHEFGHFSQDSMRLGSYVYNVNKIIHDMLFDNHSFDQSVNAIAQSNFYFGLSAIIAIKIIHFIQWILKSLYAVINKGYMGLSRQMEYHADAISAYVSGSNHIVTSLQRIELSGLSFNQLLNIYNSWLPKNLKSDNLYKDHITVLKHFAKEHEYGFVNGLIEADEHKFKNLNQSKIKIDDQWASHPTFEERAESVRGLNIETESLADSPWDLFIDANATQKDFTNKLYNHIQFTAEPTTLNAEEFENKYYSEFDENSFPKEYHKFYDTQFPVDINMDELPEMQEELMFNDLFNKEKISNLTKITFLNTDKEIIQQIENGIVDVATFDYDGRKYNKKEAAKVLVVVNNEIFSKEKEIKEQNKKVIQFFKEKAKSHNKYEEYKNIYRSTVIQIAEVEKDMEKYWEIRNEVEPIFVQEIPFLEAEKMNRKVKNVETSIKEKIRTILNEDNKTYEVSEEERELLNKYLSEELDYYKNESFQEPNIELLINTMETFMLKINVHNFNVKKEFLEYQLKLIA